MTTSNESPIKEMDTEGIIGSPRKLSVLLKSTTYQGMTDEEIDSIIEFRKEQAVNAKNTNEYIETLNKYVEGRNEQMASARERAQRNYQRALNLRPELKMVERDDNLVTLVEEEVEDATEEEGDAEAV